MCISYHWWDIVDHVEDCVGDEVTVEQEGEGVGDRDGGKTSEELHQKYKILSHNKSLIHVVVHCTCIIVYWSKCTLFSKLLCVQ